MPTLKELEELRGMQSSNNTNIDTNSTVNLQDKREKINLPDVSSFNNDKSQRMSQDVTLSKDFSEELKLNDIIEKNNDDQKTYQAELNKFKRSHHIYGDNVNNQVVSNIKDIAYKVSPYYKKYQNSSKLDFTDAEWSNIAAEYEANTKTFGLESANYTLQRIIKDRVAENQPVYEKVWKTLQGGGAQLAGASIAATGMLFGTAKYLTGMYDKNENLSGWDNFLQSVINNDITRYGNDVSTYGTFIPEEEKKLGIPYTEIMDTAEQENSLFSSNTLFHAAQSGGFTLAAMALSGGASAASKLGFRALKGLTLNAGKAAQALNATKIGLRALQKVENYTNKFLIPGMVGSAEGAIEALNTYDSVMEQGMQMLYNKQSNSAINKVKDYINSENVEQIQNENGEIQYINKNTNKVIDVDKLYYSFIASEAGKFEESKKQVEFAASKASNYNFYMNSLINGLMNTTLKSGLQSESVQNALKNSRVFGWAMPKSKFKISKVGDKFSVQTVGTKAGAAFNLIKEPFGEFLEEYFQEISDNTAQGGAFSNIETFIDNKYNGDGSVMLGEIFSSDFNAALEAAGEAAVSKQSIKAGILGFISSIIGTPYLAHKAHTKELDKNGKPINTLFGRGLNEEGKLESNWERIKRITPWRSGLLNQYNEYKRDIQRNSEEAKALEDWLNDAKNQAKFDGIIGTFNWSRSITDAYNKNDEFGYRNSSLGKLINDMHMLKQLEGTDYYETFLEQLHQVANMEEGSQEAQNYIEEYKKNVEHNDEYNSDEEVFTTLKKNANKMLDVMDNIESARNDVESLVGHLDEDSKQALIYSDLLSKDLKKRQEQLKQELSEIEIESSKEASTPISDKQKAVIAEYGSIENANKAYENYTEKLKAVKEDIKEIKKRKNKDNLTKVYLEKHENTVKSLESKIKELETVTSLDSEKTVTVLNEEEIMALPAEKRAIMFIQGANKLYKSIHRDSSQEETEDEGKDLSKLYSAEQLEVLNNLISQGREQDTKFLDKVVDLGRIESNRTKLLESYNKLLADNTYMSNFIRSAKIAARDAIAAKEYENLREIEDPKEFHKAMSDMLKNYDERTSELILAAFNRNPTDTFKKYKEQFEHVGKLFTHMESNKRYDSLTDNDKLILFHAVNYLVENGYDIRDTKEIDRGLRETDSEGNNKFEQYLEQINENTEDINNVVLEDIEEPISLLTDISNNYTITKEQNDSIEEVATEEPTPIEDTIPDQVIPEITSEDLEEGEKNLKEALLKTDDTSEQNEIESDKEESKNKTPYDFINDSELTDTEKAALEIVLNFINNYVNNNKLDESVKNKLIEFIKDYISNNDSINIEEFKNNLWSNKDIKNIPADMKTKILLYLEKNLNDTKVENNDKLKIKHYDRLQGVNFRYIRRTYPNSPLVKFYEKYGIEEYVKKNRAKIKTGKIYFYVDRNLTDQIKENMGNKFNKDRHSALIAVVEDVNGPLTIEGKKYAPVSVMSSAKDGIMGEAILLKLRKLSFKYDTLITDNEGNIIESLPTHNIKASLEEKRGQENGNKSLNTVLAESVLSPQELEEFNDKSKVDEETGEPAHFDKIYQKFKDALHSSKEHENEKQFKGDTKENFTKDKNNHPFLYLYADNFAGGGAFIKLIVTPISKAVDVRTGNSLVDILNNGSKEDIMNSNIFFKNYIEKAEKLLNEKLINGEIELAEEEDGTYKLTQDGEASVSQIEDMLKIDLGRYINIPGNARYIISRDIKIIDGVPHYSIGLEIDGNVETIASDIYEGHVDASTILKNTILNSNGEVRINDKSFDFAKFQLDYPGEGQTTEDTRTNNKNALKAGIIEISNNTIDYEFSVEVNSPNLTGTEKLPTETVTTDNNLTPSGNINEEILTPSGQVDSKDGIVDSDTGTVLKPSEEVKEQNSAAKKAEKIVEQSNRFKLKEDNSGYENDDNESFARVTSIIQADEHSERFEATVVPEGYTKETSSDGTIYLVKKIKKKGNFFTAESSILYRLNNGKIESIELNGNYDVNKLRENQNWKEDKTLSQEATKEITDYFTGKGKPNPWILPSTTIGTGMDELVRDIMGDNMEGKDLNKLSEYYPNSNNEDLKSFYEAVVRFKQEYENKGYTFISRDVVVFGNISINGRNSNDVIPVAGTLDLLAYDQNGNFHIFDMKTHLSKEVSQEKIDKYSKQLSLYKKLLEEKYGIKITSLSVIPIKVSYEAPFGVEYTTEKNNPGQLLKDGKKFTDAKPVLEPIIPITETQLNIQYNKLTENEKKLLDETIERYKIEGQEEEDNTQDISQDSNQELEQESNQESENKSTEEVQQQSEDNIGTQNEETDNTQTENKEKEENNSLDIEVEKNPIEDKTDEIVGLSMSDSNDIMDFLDAFAAALQDETFSNPMEENKVYTASEIKDIYMQRIKFYPDGYKRLANMVFANCQKLGIQFKLNKNLKSRGVYHTDTRVVEYSSVLENNTLLHEAIHATLNYYFSMSEQEISKLPEDVQKAIKDLNNLYSSMRKDIIDSIPSSVDKSFALMSTEYYGLTNIEEFVAELSNPNFRNTIIEYDKNRHKSFISKLINAIAKLLGFKSKNLNYDHIAYKSLRTLLENVDIPSSIKYANEMSNIRAYYETLNNKDLKFYDINVKEDTFIRFIDKLETLDVNEYNLASEEVTFSEETFKNYKNIRRGMLLRGNLTGENNPSQVLFVITNEPVKTDNGITFKLRPFGYKEFVDRKTLRVDKDSEGRPYLTRISNKAPKIVSARLKYGEWRGYKNENGKPINVKETLENLNNLYDEETYNSLSESEMDHLIKCIGIFK